MSARPRKDTRVTRIRKPAGNGFIRSSIVLIALAALTSCERSSELVLRIGSYVPEQSVGIRTVIKPWMDAVEAELPPGIRFQGYWGGSLGRDAFAQYDLVKHGVLDLAWVLPGYTAGQFPQIDIIELPYLVRTATEAAVAGWRLHAEGLIDGTDDVQVIGIWSTDVATIQSVEPLDVLTDVKNQKIRTAGAVQAKFINLLGGVSETMSAIEMNEAIQRGSIDGVVQAWSGIRTFRTDRLMRSSYEAPFGRAAVHAADESQGLGQAVTGDTGHLHEAWRGDAGTPCRRAVRRHCRRYSRGPLRRRSLRHYHRQRNPEPGERAFDAADS